MLLTLLAFILILAVLVLVHEFGHFFVARWFKVKVEEFGFGFPPRIASIRKGSTRFSFNWIPLGGFVKIKGEQGDEADQPGSFSSKPSRQRALILSAGILMNLALAIFLLGIGFSVGQPSVIDEHLPPNARVRDVKIQVAEVVPGSPASQSGMKVGDVILDFNGQIFNKVSALQDFTNAHTGKTISVRVNRDRGVQILKVTPRVLDDSKRGLLGVGLVQTGLIRYPIPIALLMGAQMSINVIGQIFSTLGNVFHNLVTTGHAGTELTGPVGIAVLTGQVSRLGFIYLLQFVALLSINLAIINALPIPALDGGRLLFLAIEKIRGKAVNHRLESLSHNIGFVLLLLLMVVVTYRDILHFGGRIVNAVRRALTGS